MAHLLALLTYIFLARCLQVMGPKIVIGRSYRVLAGSVAMGPKFWKGMSVQRHRREDDMIEEQCDPFLDGLPKDTPILLLIRGWTPAPTINFVHFWDPDSLLFQIVM